MHNNYGNGGHKYSVDMRPKMIPVYSRQKEFSLVSTPSRLIPAGKAGPQAMIPPKSGMIRETSEFIGPASESAYSRYSRTPDKNKGLRHFSMKVCEKVKQKGRTTYNEVADELVSEYFDQLTDMPEQPNYDMKNIRRRVYDALNVLMAMNIIEKQTKEIRWNGLPTSSLQEMKIVENERNKKEEKLREKYEQAHDLMMQLVAYKNLVRRNRQRERDCGATADPDTVLYLPYLIVASDPRSHVECNVAHDKSEFVFNFEKSFEMFDDVEALKRLGLTEGMESTDMQTDVNRNVIKKHMPPMLRGFVDDVLDEVETVRQAERAAQAAQQKSYMPSYTIVRPSSHMNNGGSMNRQRLTTQGRPMSVNSHRALSQQSYMNNVRGINGRHESMVVPSHQPPQLVMRPVKKEFPVYRYSKSLSASELGMEMDEDVIDEYGDVIYDVGATEEIAYD